MKILLIGGHLSPLLAVLDALPKEADILVVGRKYALEGDAALSLEYQTMQEKKIPFTQITTGRLQRKVTKYTFFSLSKIPVGFWQAYNILRVYKPDVIVSFGGYLALPVVCAGWIQNIPIVIHEQTLSAGISNKLASRFATKICTAWESSKNYFPKEKIVLTGNPLRKFSIFNFQFSITKEDQQLPIIYITGGSLGAHGINLLIEGCIEKLLGDFVVIHQTGDAREFKDYERLEKLKTTFSKERKKRYLLTKFINPQDVGAVLDKTTLVISRSGINTITELLAFAKPSILIPLPYGQRNEQNQNAELVVASGLGRILNQETATAEKLYVMIHEMMQEKDIYQKNVEKAKKLVPTDAAEKIVKVIYSAVSSGNKE